LPFWADLISDLPDDDGRFQYKFTIGGLGIGGFGFTTITATGKVTSIYASSAGPAVADRR
jgi:hypothetical protein